MFSETDEVRIPSLRRLDFIAPFSSSRESEVSPYCAFTPLRRPYASPMVAGIRPHSSSAKPPETPFSTWLV